MPFKCGAQVAKVKLTKTCYKNVTSVLFQITNPIFSKLERLKIKDIFTLQITKFIYKRLNLDTPEKFHDWFKLSCDSHPYNTRSNLTYKMSQNDLVWKYI